MLLKSIKYKNFRPFIGNQTVDFAGMDDMKNVVVLLGNNTAGKTTFMRSFKWCLYGIYSDEKNKANESILNKRVELSMDDMSEEEAFVEISFLDNNKSYVVKRLQKFYKQQGKLLVNQEVFTIAYTDENGQKFDIKGDEQKNEVVREILPYDLSSYFFFEGEKDNQLNKKELGSAVRRLLGLAAFGNMKQHLFGPSEAKVARSNSVIGYFYNKSKNKNSAQAQSIKDKIARLEKESVNCKSDLDQAKRTLSDNEKNWMKLKTSYVRLNLLKKF